jgi:hypothetical protein
MYKWNDSTKIPSSQATTQSSRKNKKMKIDEKDYAQKFNSKQVSCQPREAQ